MKKAKILSVAIVAVLMANLVLFATGRISGILFWAAILFSAVFAYVLLPRVRK